MPMDYHTHTPRCGHATGAPATYARRALEIGLREFAVTDHGHWMAQHPHECWAMRPGELDDYIDEVCALRDEFNCDDPERPFHVRLGLEADYIPTRLDDARAVLARPEWDVILGSVHRLGLWGLTNPPDTHHFDTDRIQDVYELYFDLIGRLVRERLCDVLAHLDLPKKFGHRPEGGMLRWIEPLIPEIRAAEMAVEINTAGLDHPCGEVYPGWDVIEALHLAGVGLTLSSDAHKPEQVGRHYGAVVARLLRLGVRSLVGFDRRRPFEVPLDPGLGRA